MSHSIRSIQRLSSSSLKSRALSRSSSVIPSYINQPIHQSSIRQFRQKIRSTNALPDPTERQSALWQNEKHKLPVYIIPIGMGARSIILNRPEALNALNLEMVDRLTGIIKACESDPDIQVVMIEGAGSKAFCAGGDVRALHTEGLKRKAAKNRTGAHDFTKQFFRREYSLNFLLHATRVSVVPVLNGITMGGGYGISGHCRYRCATPDTLFAMPETAIGFFPDVGATYLLPRLNHPGLGEYLGLTGARLKGYDLIHAGIATHFSTHDDWSRQLEIAFSTTGSMAQQAEDALEIIGWRLSEDELIPEPEFSITKPQLELIRTVFLQPSVELIFEQLEAAAAQSNELADFAVKTLATLKKASPMSLKVTHEAMRRAKHLSLIEALEIEYRLSQRFILGEDFYIGVDSALISKDRNPQWTTDLKSITDADVEAYFAPLTDQPELKLEYPSFKESQWYI